MARPFKNKKTAELERLFAQAKRSPSELQQLLEELQFRTVPSAVKLRRKVEAAIAGIIEATQKSLKFESEAPETRQPVTRKKRRVRSISSDEHCEYEPDDDVVPPTLSPTRIQQIGVQGRPSAYKPTLKSDLRLPLPKNASSVTRYRVCLDEHIKELKRSGHGHQKFTLEDGKRASQEGGRTFYQFDFPYEANIFEGARIELLLGGEYIDGSVVSINAGKILLALGEDFGPRILSCVLRIDSTALLQALHDRLQAIESGTEAGFRPDFADRVLSNRFRAETRDSIAKWPWTTTPNPKQSSFLSVARCNDITWLWGPPGTGKTDVLSALCHQLFSDRQRVLICSNTNQAVDQVLLKLGRNLRTSNPKCLEDGNVIRLGRLEHPDLKSEFANDITLEGITARKSKSLIEKKKTAESDLQMLEIKFARVQEFLARFREVDKLEIEWKRRLSVLEEGAARLNTIRRQRKEAKQREETLAKELADRRRANFLIAMFLRSEEAILRDSTETEQRQVRLAQSQSAEVASQEKLQADAGAAAAEVNVAKERVSGFDRAQCEKDAGDLAQRRTSLRVQIAELAKQIEEVEQRVLKEARIVGATATRTFLRPIEFSNFDCVIVDEASMLLLPAAFHVAGLATKKVIIAGDFRQLPPIVQTEQQAIHEVIGHDIFQEAEIDKVVERNPPANAVTLTEQYRMVQPICDVISHAFYAGMLTTSSVRSAEAGRVRPSPLDTPICLIDSASVSPFTTRDPFGSRANLMHALIARNLALFLEESGCVVDEKGRKQMGFCTPYAAQARLMRKILKTHKLDEAIRASTAHGFQGDERELIVFDLVDSLGEYNPGIFLQATSLNETGAKLLNVALSRPKSLIAVIANRTYLDAHLPGDAILRGVLYQLQETGRVIDAKDILALRPIIDDLASLSANVSLDPESVRTGLFNNADFTRLVECDFRSASKSIVIFSGFITPQRIAQIGDILRRKIGEGVAIRCVTRPPNRNGSISFEQGEAAIQALRQLGVVVDLRAHIHEKVIIIDEDICWFGSLNALSHTDRTSELMARIRGRDVAIYIDRMLAAIRRRADAGIRVKAENPVCPKCNCETVLMKGKFGLFFKCQRCNWTVSADKVRDG